MRFYPAELPPFANEPTRDRFAIHDFGERIGEGVVTLADFRAGDTVFAFTGYLVPAPTKFTLQVAPGVHVHDPYFMGKVLHHCDPNCSVQMNRRLFVARRPILRGEAITMDYDETEDHLHRAFECDCGAPNCRRTISGRSRPR